MSDEIDFVTTLIGPRRLSKDSRSRRCLDMRVSIKELIRSSKQELIIAAYRLDSEELINLIIERAEAGVNVQIHLDYGQVNDHAAPRDAYDRLIQNGINVERWAEDWRHSLHAKVLIADSERAIIGSANLTDRGMDRNIELGIQLSGPTVNHLRSAILLLMDPRINED